MQFLLPKWKVQKMVIMEIFFVLSIFLLSPKFLSFLPLDLCVGSSLQLFLISNRLSHMKKHLEDDKIANVKP